MIISCVIPGVHRKMLEAFSMRPRSTPHVSSACNAHLYYSIHIVEVNLKFIIIIFKSNLWLV